MLPYDDSRRKKPVPMLFDGWGYAPLHLDASIPTSAAGPSAACPTGHDQPDAHDVQKAKIAR
jgi:hypothetical protein